MDQDLEKREEAQEPQAGANLSSAQAETETRKAPEAMPVEAEVEAKAEAEQEAKAEVMSGDDDNSSDDDDDDTHETDNEGPAARLTTVQEAESLLSQLKDQVEQKETPAKSDMDRLAAFLYTYNSNRNASTLPADEVDGEAEEGAEREGDDEIVRLQNEYKELRNTIAQETKLQFDNNLKLKKELLERMSALLSSTEQFGKIKTEFYDIRDEWAKVGDIPQNEKAEVLKEYQRLSEQFYEINTINNEFREYDFAKNKVEKGHLIEMAEKLDEDEDVLRAFNQLQTLHDHWRETGPVSPDDRESMWMRFKEASTVINKKHQDYFTGLREKENENLERKTKLCEQAEELAATEPEGKDGWRKQIEKVTALQEEWRTIGYAPKKFNAEIYKRFRTAVSQVYAGRKEFQKEQSAEIEEKLKVYRRLDEEANALKESKDWKNTAERMMQLQEEWKAVGKLGKRVAEAGRLWHSFSEACTYFFNNKQADLKQRNEQRNHNLEKKREIIAKLEGLKGSSDEDLKEQVDALQEEWKGLGYVPNKYKDELNNQYYGLVRELAPRGPRGGNNRRGKDDNEKVNTKAPQREVSSYGLEDIDDEIRRSTRIVGRIEEEITQYENNLGFFIPTGSDSNNPLAQQVERKIGLLKEDKEKFEQRVADLRSRKKELVASSKL